MAWLGLLKDVPLTAVVRERLAHEEKIHEGTKTKNAELQVQIDELTKELEIVRAELATMRAKDALKSEFVDRGGYLWKHSGEGPSCRTCKGALRRFGSRHICTSC